MEYIRCNTCQGSKIVMGGGMMMKECDDCGGTGKRFKGTEKELESEIKRNIGKSKKHGSDQKKPSRLEE